MCGKEFSTIIFIGQVDARKSSTLSACFFVLAGMVNQGTLDKFFKETGLLMMSERYERLWTRSLVRFWPAHDAREGGL